MLRREDAEKRLQKFHNKNWKKARLAAFGRLPDKLGTIGRALLGYDSKGKSFSDWDKQMKALEEARNRLSGLSAGERQKIFAVFFPKIARHLEAGWQLLGRLPYQTEYQRKAFRAPGDAEAYRLTRAGWLENLVARLEGYDEDLAWYAAWAPHLGYGYAADAVGVLLAAAIDAGGAEGEAIFNILRESAKNEHEIGSMGRHVTRGLLVASRPDGWEFIEKLLLAAQRQEGLRQVILESIDEAHPQAFRRMVRLILDQNLLRFSAAVRAVDVWFGLGWDAVSTGVVKKTLEQVMTFLDDAPARKDAIANGDPETLYLALWSVAFEDAGTAIKPAARLLDDPSVERRFVAAHFLGQLDLPAAQTELARCLDDEDLRIALHVLDEFCEDGQGDLFDRLLRLLERMPPKSAELPALVWPWMTIRADRSDVADKLVTHLGDRPTSRLIPYLSQMGFHGKSEMLDRIVAEKKYDDGVREALFALVGDSDSSLREEVLTALKSCSVAEADALRLEGFLTRKKADLRRAVLTLLKKQKTPAVMGSADRLLASAKPNQRLGGLEVLRQLVESKRGVAECRQRAEQYRADHPRLSEEEELQIEVILDMERVVPKLDDALGLMGDMQHSPAIPPRACKVAFLTPAAVACLSALDDLIHQHRETQVTIEGWNGPEEVLLGNLNSWQFPGPEVSKPIEADAAHLPLREVWEQWLQQRPKKLADRDGLELVRALAWSHLGEKEWKAHVKRFGKEWRSALSTLSGGLTPPRLRHADLVFDILRWLLRMHPPTGAFDFLLDAMETAFTLVPRNALDRVVDLNNWQQREKDWRISSPAQLWEQNVNVYLHACPEELTPEQRLRRWHLLHWREQPAAKVGRLLPELELTLAAYQARVANDADVLDQLLVWDEDANFDTLREVTALKPPEVVENCPPLRQLIDRCRERILEIELARGEMPTAASEPALRIGSLFGLDTLLRLLSALGKKAFSRSTYGKGRLDVLTHLLRVTQPAVEDTPEEFAARTNQAGVSRERLLELAFLAPQWLKHVEHALGWEGLREGLWWFLAHMPGGRNGLGGADPDEFNSDDEDDSGAGSKKLDPWERLLRERTPLTSQERAEGAVDAAWFHRVFTLLGKKRWLALAAPAKFGCSGQGHKRAGYLADVLRGQAKKSDLIAGIRVRQLRDSVRLLGLLPLATGERRAKDLLARYRVIQEYRRYARGLSPMSRESAVRTGDIGLENLARTAEYPDPVRLEWAMEARAIADLAGGPISATHQGVTVTLSLDEQAQPQLTIQRGDKPLKNIPSVVRKHPKVATLADRKTDLKRQASRMRLSLENAMCRGDTFTGAELRQLFDHPILVPSLERLVLLGEGVAGYPTAKGQGLADQHGKIEPIKPNEKLRIAHPHDFLSGDEWPLWQKHLFEIERVQPFKQVFRELYVITGQEKADGAVSHRYAGQQVNPKQAMALFGSRGWGTQEGVAKTFHDLGLVADVSFRSGAWTPLELEGLTLEGVQFRRHGEWTPMLLADVPPRAFSEVMRDVDLVVSVAHLGGVDPEASASTVEMRSALLRETCSLLKIDNFRIEKSHVLIDGHLNKYSVHLGSAVVHRQPGGSLCIVPVHAQQRGRLFLPFADDDPRTAEVLSKVILLARDQEIQDPGILEQIR